MTDVPQAVVDESRANIAEWAAQARAALVVDASTSFAVTRVADLVAALGHPGAGRALADAAYAVAQMAALLERKTGQRLDAADALSLLGTAGLVLADREAAGARAGTRAAGGGREDRRQEEN